MAEDDHGRERDGPQQGEDHVTKRLKLRGTVDPSRLTQLLRDATQAGQEHRHTETAHLPDRRDGQRVQRRARARQPARLQEIQVQIVKEHVEAVVRVEDPAPDRAGDDEGDGQREHEDVLKDDGSSKLLVEQHRRAEPEDQAAGEEEGGEVDGVDDVGLELLRLEQPLVVPQADEGIVRHHPAPGRQRRISGPADEAVDEDRDQDHRRRDHQDRHHPVPRQRSHGAAPSEPLHPDRRRGGRRHQRLARSTSGIRRRASAGCWPSC